MPVEAKVPAQNALETTDLSRRAIHGAQRVGTAVGNYIHGNPGEFLAFLGLAATHAVTSFPLSPETPFSNLIPFIPPPRVAGQDVLYGLALTSSVLSNALLVKKSLEGGIAGLGHLVNRFRHEDELEKLQEQVRLGTAEITYPYYSAFYDCTNEAVGNHQGDAMRELSMIVSEWPELKELIEKVTGPIVEFVTEKDVQPPLETPIWEWLKTQDISETQEFLIPIAHAQRVGNAVGVFLNHNYTIHDKRVDQRRPMREAMDTFGNMCDSIDTIKSGETAQEVPDSIAPALQDIAQEDDEIGDVSPDEPKKIRRFAIVNNHIATLAALASSDSTLRVLAESQIIEKLERDNYRVINAEVAHMDDLMADFRSKGYKRIVIVDDGSDPGNDIAAEFIRFYNDEYKIGKTGLPELLESKQEEETADLKAQTESEVMTEDRLSTALNSLEYDAIVCIGGDDKQVVNNGATEVLARQSDGRLKQIKPVEIILEGRGVTETVQRKVQSIKKTRRSNDAVQRQRANHQSLFTHYVHNALMRKLIDMLVEDVAIIDWRNKKITYRDRVKE